MIPTNWDDDLIEEIKGLPVSTIFGKLQSDYFGGGRPSIYIPSVSRKIASKHIALIHKYGYKFNYLLNTSCMNNEEFTRRGQYKMQKFMRWLLRNEIDSITVAIPYLARWVKRNYPTLKIKASIIANIDTVKKAKYWQDLGADSITLSLDCNRDFTLLEGIVENVKCEIVPIVNLACLSNCPFSLYHYVLGSHASQLTHKLKGFYIDYCMIFCSYLRLLDPAQIIRSCWIRPEDLSYYENIGINSFKIVGRILPIDKIVKIVKAYSERNYRGDLLDILSPFVGQSPFNLEKFIRGIKYMFRPFNVNIFRLANLKRITRENFIEVDNQGLNNFLEGFKDKNCRLMNCDDCNYCQNIANKVIKVDLAQLNELKNTYKNILESIESGRMFRYI